MTGTEFLNPKSLKLLAALEASRDRAFYRDHRTEIDELLLAPARHLVVEVGEILKKRIPALVADPRVDRSIYRLFRDTRFSPDKRPYKGHLGLIWWEDRPAGKLGSPCFYFHLTGEGWLWSTGIYQFEPNILKAWRLALAEPKTGESFLKIADQIMALGLTFNPPELKRPPAGFENSATQDWARHKGLYTWSEASGHDRRLFGPKAAALIAEKLLSTENLFRFLSSLFAEKKPSADTSRSARSVEISKRDFNYQEDF
ncbi:MAG: TIGR02453 family protein [Deltaproteobacteria bacterium]|jgi:uncharacterized protein (TIGR02453 family)|nr:TIGR02453 family protein [Deltaproteobacteria bacterium]